MESVVGITAVTNNKYHEYPSYDAVHKRQKLEFTEVVWMLNENTQLTSIKSLLSHQIAFSDQMLRDTKLFPLECFNFSFEASFMKDAKECHQMKLRIWNDHNS